MLFLVLTILFYSSSAFEVAGYLPEYRYGAIKDWDGVMSRLTQLILFSLEVGHNGELKDHDRFPSPELLTTIQESAARHKTKVTLCLGGNSRSGGFSSVALIKGVRDHFVEHILEFLLRNKLDGLDLNWEYPSSQQEWSGLFTLIKELKAAFTPHNMILTMAIYPGQETLLPGDVISALDFIHTMVYDQRDRHSTVEFAKTSIKNIQHAIGKRQMKKITLGVPFYGRRRRDGEPITYQELVNNNPDVDIAGTNEYGGYYYNGVKTIQAKTRFALKKELGGVMIWEVGQDISDPTSEISLLNALHATIQQREKKDL